MPRSAPRLLLVAVITGLISSGCSRIDADQPGTTLAPTTLPQEATVPTPDPTSPLLEAVGAPGPESGILDEVRALLARGADATVRDASGSTAADLARARGADRTAVLLDRADDPVQRPNAALLSAADQGDADGVALALRAGADVEARDARRRTPLLLTVIGNHLGAAEVLVSRGADPDAVDDQSDTPWLVTGVTGAMPMTRLLTSLDPDVTLRNRYGGVSIIPASERGHVDYVRWVTAHTDIDVNHVNDLGWTALLEAVILGEGTAPWQEIVRILLDAGADPGITDADGVSALAHARARGFDEIAALLAG